MNDLFGIFNQSNELLNTLQLRMTNLLRKVSENLNYDPNDYKSLLSTKEAIEPLLLKTQERIESIEDLLKQIFKLSPSSFNSFQSILNH